MAPFDAVLVIAFGGPQGPDDIRPFLANVLRGRRVTPERVEEVAHHYERFGGVSPLTALTGRQAEALQAALAARGTPLPVYVGMRNWHPYLADTLAQMARDGVRRAIGWIAAAHRSYSSCTQYRENVAAARAELAARRLADVQICYTGDWHAHPGFVEANAARVREARSRLPPEVRDAARIVFTAHSIPVSMAQQYPYPRQIEETARLVAVAERNNRATSSSDDASSHPGRGYTPAEHEVVFQSRSGRPEDPWLGPDVCDYLREASRSGLKAAVISPIGFLCDHVEVLYDLDVEAAAVCREAGMPMARAEAVNDHPRFIEAVADAVLDTYGRYDRARPLPVVAAAAP